MARAYGGVSGDDRKSQRREKLLEAALALYGTAGFHASTVKGICLKAGLTERYFYESFSSSQALLAALYQQQVEALTQRMVNEISRAAQNPAAIAEAALTEWFGTMKRDPRLGRLMLVEVLGISPEIDELYRQTMSGMASLLLETTPASVKEELSDVDFELVAFGLVGASVTMAMKWMLEGFRTPQKKVVKSCLRVFLAVVAP